MLNEVKHLLQILRWRSVIDEVAPGACENQSVPVREKGRKRGRLNEKTQGHPRKWPKTRTAMFFLRCAHHHIARFVRFFEIFQQNSLHGNALWGVCVGNFCDLSVLFLCTRLILLNFAAVNVKTQYYVTGERKRNGVCSALC